MKTRTKALIGTGVIAVAAITGTGIALSLDDDDTTEVPIIGPALEQATRAAPEHTGGRTVTDTEFGDEESLYEVEVTLADGSQVDVQLDENFAVVEVSADDDSSEDDS